MLEVIAQNVRMAQEVVRETVRRIDPSRRSPYAGLLEHSLVTRRDLIPAATREALEPLIGRYLDDGGE